MKEKIKSTIISAMEDLKTISRELYNNPELGHEEFKSCELLENYLESYGFNVEKGIYNIPTAFKGSYNSSKKGPCISFLCEYDALPEIGHGCGHNLISAMGIGAAIGLKSVLDEIGGKIIVYGTPAEETSGAKVKLVNEGAFKDVDIAMMVHPSPTTEESGTSLALTAIQFEFLGKTAHAAVSPEKGINSLEAAIMTYNNVNALRQYVTSDVRIHGIIKDGGKAANIIPDYACIQFYIRANKRKYRDEVVQKVIKCAEAASSSVGAKVKISYFEEAYDDLNTNKVLSNLFNENLRGFVQNNINQAKKSFGSVDMGNVSQVVPAIHPWIGVGNENLVLHSREFADYTQTKDGENTIYKGACAMAMTAYDFIISDELQKKVKEEFHQN